MPTLRDREGEHDREGISRLTVEALDAAERGQWDRVQACYEARASRLHHKHVSANLAHALLALDARVMEQVNAAQAATGHALAEARAAQKRWKTLSNTIHETVPIGKRVDRQT
ncbi:hypothetical protein YTPLAS18_26960 [Nitrospira sp.]|nr:hypothetical protein YTPLAS18_26960 [Nitrospira sp.]